VFRNFDDLNLFALDEHKNRVVTLLVYSLLTHGWYTCNWKM